MMNNAFEFWFNGNTVPGTAGVLAGKIFSMTPNAA
jgi:hypothetical protein